MEEKESNNRKKPPDHLYHYTSIEGVEGILSKRSLWASQIHFLNDTQEFKYSVDILGRVLLELRNELPNRVIPALGPMPLPCNAQEFLSDVFREIAEKVIPGPFDRAPVCVFSLSEYGDLLSQWRGYCPPNGGYSIGFRSGLLDHAQIIKQGGTLQSCVYEERDQEFLIKGRVHELRERLLKIWSGSNFTKEFTEDLVNFYIDFSRIACTLKNPSFYEEHEWRIVSALIPNQYMSFRVKKSILVPYYSFSISDIDPFPADEIIIGPSPEQRLAESSLRQFVLKQGLNISIKKSKIPYRELK